MATLRNNKVTGLFTDEVENNNNAVTKTYADGVLPPTLNNDGSVLQKSGAVSSNWYYSEPPVITGCNNTNNYGWAHGDLIVSMGQCHKDISASTDSIHWSARTFPALANNCGSSWADGGWVDDGGDGLWYRVDGQVLAFSTDSIHWTLRTSGENSGGFNVGYSNNSRTPQLHYKAPYYFTSQWSNEVHGSTDTIHWEQRSCMTGDTVYTTSCAFGQAIIGNSNNGIQTSTDWYHWVKRTTSVCGDVTNISVAGDYVFAAGANVCTSGGAPYPVSVNISTDTIHWCCCPTGYTTCCSSWNFHPASVTYHQGRYYTAFQKADGSGGCCRPFYISSTDVVHWETEMDGCAAGQTCTGSYYCGDHHRVISNDDFVLIGTCGNSNSCGWLVKPAQAGQREWNRFTGFLESASSTSLISNSRGSITLTPDNCPIFSYTFPKETQYVSMEIQGGGHGGGGCISRTSQLYQYGGRGGAFCHLLFNKCDISCSDNTDFQICINGDTVTGAPQINPNWGGVEVSQDSNLATFHKNMHAFTCGCCCIPYTGFSGLDASGNEVMVMGAESSYPLWSSLDGGITWRLRTGAGSCKLCSGLYVDGCPGHFRAIVYNKLIHSTDTIHWFCCCLNQHGNCCIVKLSYQNSAYWASGCKHLSCSPDGTTWYHRTVGQGNVNCTFAYDSSGGYLISGMTTNYLSASTDSIHWSKRTIQQCCISGFRYCNSKWYSFGWPIGGNYEQTYVVNSSTDTIHWKSECCLTMYGGYDRTFDGHMAGATNFALGPNNETILTISEPSNELMCDHDGGGCYNRTETLKSTTDFVHWKDLSRNLNGYRSRQAGYQNLCYNCFLDLNYSSDTKRFIVSSKGCCCNICTSYYNQNFGVTSGYLQVKYTVDGTTTYTYSQNVQSSAGSDWCQFCSATCPNAYYMSQECNSWCSMRHLQKVLYGGDGPRAGTSCPGVQTAFCGCCGRGLIESSDSADFGASGASSGGASGPGTGGGSCSSLGDTPDTVIDESELKQYEITVSVSSGQYRLTGEDRGGSFSNSANRNLTVKSGDLIAFTLDGTVSGHPFWIKLENSTGTTDRILAKFVKENGLESGVVILDTYKLKPGTYHYNCQYHSSMHGTITVEAAVVSLDGENGTGSNYSFFGSGGAAGYTYKTGYGVWTQRTTPASSRDGGTNCFSKLYYGCNNWIHTTQCSIESSTDTIHWFLRTTGLSVTSGKQLCYPTVAYGLCGSSPQWFLASQNQRDAVTSTDTIHWTLRTLGLDDNSQLKTAYGNGCFVLKQSCHHTASTDGIHWKLRTTGCCGFKNDAYGAETLQYADGLWVTSGNTYNAPLAASTDTIHWTLRTTGMYGWYLYSATHAGDVWHINGESCSSFSTDTIHWKNRACVSSPSPSQCSPMVLYDGKYILGSRYSCLTSISCDTIGLTDYSTRVTMSHVNKGMSQVSTYITGLAMDDATQPQLMAGDGIGVWAMSKNRSRSFAGNGGDGCNGGGAGAGGMYFDKENAWSYSGYNGKGGLKKIRITWW